MSNSNADEPPENYTTHPPPPPSLSSLPDEIVLRCLARVPRSYHLSLSWVSKNLKALVRSLPELNGQRSILHKRSSLYLCFQQEYNDSSFHWFTLCPTEETSTTEYQLLSNSTPFPPHKYGSSTVAVGSNIFFIGRSRRPSSDLWILDTRSGNMTQGPSMSVPRNVEDAAVGVIDGKIYVIGGGGYHEEIQVEVFHPKSETWELAGIENMRTIPRSSASVEGKVYMVEYEKTSVYNPRECEGQRLVKIVSERLSERGRKETVPDTVERVCVVEDVLFA
ncbi:F-box/kelch-repeat protein At2g22050 isoform X1 [Brassica rapa]|uniref:F-box/kelch-repeat protein At2g22050 isoform X1 n=1 Tax=Brassica campestris TaxID=3711 RepID=UPI0004F16FB8|nr:F-box/kelch-repeat protein At2g22050 isoform X1 [Brassica rapa]XP_033137070.1 F-box/kelch-repeat protein At2g22050 isoform X1 [Brassica rapa]